MKKTVSMVYILAPLVILFFLYPFLSESAPLFIVLNGIFTILLLLGVWKTNEKMRIFQIALFLGLFSFACTAFLMLTTPSFLLSPYLVLLLFGSNVLFYIFCTIHLFKYILYSKKITEDTIYGAIMVYLLIGIVWGNVYHIVETFVPGSFQKAIPTTPMQADFLYFSFSTLLTIGYGDITPANSIVRSLAIIEALMGVFYIAIFISRLISNYSKE